jgi:hypothetical protein
MDRCGCSGARRRVYGPGCTASRPSTAGRRWNSVCRGTVCPGRPTDLPAFKHVLTHKDLYLHPVRLEMPRFAPPGMEGQWFGRATGQAWGCRPDAPVAGSGLQPAERRGRVAPRGRVELPVPAQRRPAVGKQPGEFFDQDTPSGAGLRCTRSRRSHNCGCRWPGSPARRPGTGRCAASACAPRHAAGRRRSPAHRAL